MQTRWFMAVAGLLSFFFSSAAVMGQALDGRKIYQEKKCFACHGMAGAGSIAGPSIQDLKKSKEELIDLLRKGTKKMRPLKKATDEEVAAIVDYISTLKRPETK